MNPEPLPPGVWPLTHEQRMEFERENPNDPEAMAAAGYKRLKDVATPRFSMTNCWMKAPADAENSPAAP